ncbi:Type 1 glutamine amidotransferase-like domain-containing protein [Sutcliffiella rhizosphaerae]|uniref:Peptidase E n=1 Tax=Sutcliffiella rhizosphaerae TaxID=2880967 RepID=A0ABM8YR26_9BACI|nr:peptidase E [Sutcliffiella rhizosphaerae]CAG9622394.1 hypothetical protein BACCIP111883_03185 [Sutcliffiella rhizosphaerae]
MKQIIALGGGGFSMEPANLLLDSYILKQSRNHKPKICFLPTASGDAQNYIDRFYNAFEKLTCIPSHLSLFKPPTKDIESYILEKDIIYVGGGNTKNLLALWRDWNVDKILLKGYQQGIILTGISAGSICWYEEGLTDSFGDELEPITCLGFLQGSNSPHYDGEANRRPTFQNLIASRQLKPGIAADDGVGIHYVNGEIKKIVSSRPKARAYLVNEMKEVPLHTFYLGGGSHYDE